MNYDVLAMKKDFQSKNSSVESQSGKQTIPRQTTGGVTPLSFAQQRMWFSQQLDPTSPVYNVFRTWRVLGALDIEVLKSALQTIVRRHNVLRAMIQVIDGAPQQVIVESLTIELPVVDLRGCSSEDLQTVCKESIQQEVRRPFDLTQGPLFVAKLWRLGDEDHVILLCAHHIIADGWSFGVLYKEIGALYEAITDGKSSPLPDLPFQYGDYAVEQRNSLEGARLENLLGYWKKQLAELPPRQLPTARSGASWATVRGERAGCA